MRILLAHNRYQQRGGEDIVFETERALLENAGHEVTVFERDNHEIETYSSWKLTDLSRRTIWATDSTAAIRRVLREARPQVAHFYNTFPLISPAAYYACGAAKVPVVQTLPNFRLFCPSSDFHRNGSTCELCLSRAIAWPAILHRCYRGSFRATTVVAAMIAFHRMVKTWKRKVTTYIALTQFSKNKFIAGGLPADRIVVKPNFISPDPGPRTDESDYALFVGRLSREKGIATLLRAWKDIPAIPLTVAGDGPLMPMVEKAAAHRADSEINPIGWRPRSHVIKLLKNARFLIIPSEWYEGFPMTIVEAFACGIPVVGSRLGGIGEVVRHEISGLLFEPGNSEELAAAVNRLWADRNLRIELGKGARSQYESLYTSEKNYAMMMTIFENAVQSLTSP